MYFEILSNSMTCFFYLVSVGYARSLLPPRYCLYLSLTVSEIKEDQDFTPLILLLSARTEHFSNTANILLETSTIQS